MNYILELMVGVLKAFPAIFANPIIIILYFFVLLLVGRQYARVQHVEESFYGEAKNKALYQTIIAVALGLLGGLLASFMLVFIGVTLTVSGIIYLLPIALILFFINPRFMCYAYAGGIASTSYLVFGWPQINVPAVMALVACLHLVESVLIRISGASCATPLYLKRKDGCVVGGFGLQRYWPIPMITLFMVKVPDLSALESLIETPEWWPLIAAPEIPGPGVAVFAMMPLIAALGYGDVAVTKSPDDKARYTSRILLAYSVVLMVLAIASTAVNWPRWLTWFAALFSPLGHELVIKLSSKNEMTGAPLYGTHPEGVTLLEVIPGKPAHRGGLSRGQVIFKANGYPVTNRADIQQAAADSGTLFLEVYDPITDARKSVRISKETGEPLGIITVPEPGDKPIAQDTFRWYTG